MYCQLLNKQPVLYKVLFPFLNLDYMDWAGLEVSVFYIVPYAWPWGPCQQYAYLTQEGSFNIHMLLKQLHCFVAKRCTVCTLHLFAPVSPNSSNSFCQFPCLLCIYVLANQAALLCFINSNMKSSKYGGQRRIKLLSSFFWAAGDEIFFNNRNSIYTCSTIYSTCMYWTQHYVLCVVVPFSSYTHTQRWLLLLQ